MDSWIAIAVYRAKSRIVLLATGVKPASVCFATWRIPALTPTARWVGRWMPEPNRSEADGAWSCGTVWNSNFSQVGNVNITFSRYQHRSIERPAMSWHSVGRTRGTKRMCAMFESCWSPKRCSGLSVNVFIKQAVREEEMDSISKLFRITCMFIFIIFFPFLFFSFFFFFILLILIFFMFIFFNFLLHRLLNFLSFRHWDTKVAVQKPVPNRSYLTLIPTPAVTICV